MSEIGSAEPAPGGVEQRIYERLLDRILDHRLQPGTKLVEDRLAEAFGVSRTKVRPVLVRLASEQIVTLTPNRGATVTLPSPAEAHEVFEARRLIEPTLLRLCIARAEPAQLRALGQDIADETAARLAGELRRAIRLSGRFHLRIAAAARHATLERILHGLVSRTSLVLMAYGAPTPDAQAAACGCDEHRALLDAIRLRDADEAVRRLLTHLGGIEDGLMFPGQGPVRESLAELLAP